MILAVAKSMNAYATVDDINPALPLIRNIP